MKNGLCKIVTKSQVVTIFNVTKSRLQCCTIIHTTVRLKKMKKENQLLRFTKNYSLKQQNLNYTYANELFLFSFHLALPPAHPKEKIPC